MSFSLGLSLASLSQVFSSLLSSPNQQPRQPKMAIPTPSPVSTSAPKPLSQRDIIENTENQKPERKNRFKEDHYKTPLHAASANGDLARVKELVSEKADLNCIDFQFGTPLILACCYKHLDVVDYLLENGANIEATDVGGSTVLYHACRLENFEMVKYLVERGADMNKKNNCGFSPFWIANQFNSYKIVNFMEEYKENNSH